MADIIACEPITLAPRATLVLAQMAHAEIRCRRGNVWITQYGDHRDLVVAAGEAVVLQRPTATVITASGGAEVLITRHAARPAPRPSIGRWLAGLFDPRWSSRAGCALRQPGRQLRHG